MKEKEGESAAKSAKSVRETAWSLYILRCADGSFYTGVTNDVDRRLRMHREGTASRYTRTRRPVELLYSETCGGRSDALVRECAVKALSRERKEDLVSGKGRLLPGGRRLKPAAASKSKTKTKAQAEF